ncbi:MAG: tetratricopeptide repeat protein, partial [Planctomycetales bacterium]|nr:tetratricopeptide repeat protein [Planctomycetales bacterium]
MNNHEPGGTGERSRRTSAWVVETTRETFEADVWERSEQVPIVVDFWAPWCAPCRALGPVLERLAGEYEGQFELVKVNMDEVPEAAAQFQVQSIPMVVGLRHREVVDFFVGALPESHLRAFLDRIVPSAAERLVLEARLLQETEPDGAIQRLRQAMELEPNQSAATIACGQLLVDLGRYEEAAEIVEQLEGRGFLEPEAQRVQAAVQRHQQGAEAGDVAACREALAAEPDNP